MLRQPTKSSKAHARAIGSLVLGYYENGELIRAGRVGTGFTEQVALELLRRLEAMWIPTSPFAWRLARADARDMVFVRPEPVAEVSSAAGRLTDWCASPRSVACASISTRTTC